MEKVAYKVSAYTGSNISELKRDKICPRLL